MKELLSRTPSPETVNVASFWQSLSAFASSFLKLVVLEARQAATGVALMLAFALGAAALIVTAWLALIAWVIALFVQSGVLGWAAGFFVAAILSVGGAAVLVFLLLRRAKSVRFEATRRQLAGESPEEGDYERTA